MLNIILIILTTFVLSALVQFGLNLLGLPFYVGFICCFFIGMFLPGILIKWIYSE